jgi:hypothetical protein
MTDEQFNEYVEKCYEELQDKQEQLFNTYNMGAYESYWFDQLTKSLQFKNKNEVLLEFKIICIGTWAHEKNTWMWGWANESFTNEIREDSKVLKGLKEFTGYDVFEEDGFECDESMAYEAAAMALNYLNALGMYRIPGEKSHLFVALMEKK